MTEVEYQAFKRASIIKSYSLGGNIVDLVKSTHFMERLAERKLDFHNVLVCAELALNKAVQAWIQRNLDDNFEGVIQWKKLNIIFGLTVNRQTKHVDYKLISAIERKKFYAKPEDCIIQIGE